MSDDKKRARSMSRERSIRRIALALPLIIAATLMAMADRSGSESHADDVRRYYLGGIERLQSSVDSLDAAVRAWSEGEEEEPVEAQAIFARVRIHYKLVEPLIGYLDRYSASLMNGPPLPKVDEHTNERRVIEPEGLQVIEEILFADDPGDELKRLRTLTDRLRIRVRTMQKNARAFPIEDRRIFEAMRAGLIRVAFLGLTGFDTPVSSDAIVEARTSMQSIRSLYSIYRDDLSSRSAVLDDTIIAAFDRADRILGSDIGFDELDRLDLIRTTIDPLYGLLYDAHVTLGYPTVVDLSPYNRPVRYTARTLFGAETFDPYFYSPDPADRPDPLRTALGEKLFADPLLSVDGSRSCATCHSPEKGFADGLVYSAAIGGDVLARNTPSLINIAFQSAFFWDGRTEHLELQVEDVLLNHTEMGMTFEALIERLRGREDYRDAFARTYRGTGDTAVTKFAITRAIGAYIRSLVDVDTEFDRYMRREIDRIDPSVARGFNLFMGKASCGTCHFAPLFNGVVPPDYLETETEVLGVTATADFAHPRLDDDRGRYNRRLDEIYRGSFKTPTIRNVAATAPYMHNGAFATLEEVVEFYERGGGAGLGLDVPNQTLPPDRLNLTEQEKADLVAFMRALGSGSRAGSKP